MMDNQNYINSGNHIRVSSEGSPDHLNLFLKDTPLKDNRTNFNITPIKPQEGAQYLFNTDMKETGEAYRILNTTGLNNNNNNMTNNNFNNTFTGGHANNPINVVDGRYGGVVIEALLRDERRNLNNLEEELRAEQARFKDMKRVADERERSLREAEIRLKNVKKELEETREDLHTYERRNVEYQLEVEDLIRQLDSKDVEVAGLLGDIEKLKMELEEKTRLLKEKREFFQKVHENRAVDEIRRQADIEKEILQLENEKIKEELSYMKTQFQKSEEGVASLKIALKQKVEAEMQIRTLKQKLLETENKFKEKNEFSRKAQIRSNLIDNLEELNEGEREGLYIDFEKELETQELILKGLIFY